MVKLAFFGLGMMGLPMAGRLSDGPEKVIGFDRTPAAKEGFRSAGGTVAETMEDAIAGADVVITMLPDGNTVRSLLVGGECPVSSMAAGGLVIDMSSSEPEGTRSLASELASLDITLIDAPVSGGVKKAVDGSLAIMVGGEAAALERARPLLSRMGSKIFHAGPVGAGHAMKALNNFVSAAGLAALCEALVIARRFGIEGEAVVDILNASTGRNNSTENKAKPFMLSGAFDSGFALALMSKDIGIAEGLSRSLQLSSPLLERSRSLWSEAAATLGEGADHTEYLRFLEAKAGDQG